MSALPSFGDISSILQENSHIYEESEESQSQSLLRHENLNGKIYNYLFCIYSMHK
jgi:hypothetical protein